MFGFNSPSRKIICSLLKEAEAEIKNRESFKIIGGDSFYPKNDREDDKAHKIEKALVKAGFKRSKSKYGGEYQFIYKKGNDSVTVNYRYGQGYMAIWLN